MISALEDTTWDVMGQGHTFKVLFVYKNPDKIIRVLQQSVV